MDELEIDGKTYLSSKRAAREHKYHIDYIGQLIRGGKIVGKKVGRSWYVEAQSLKGYLAAESAAPQQPEEKAQEPQAVPVQPIVSQRDPTPSPFEPVEAEERMVIEEPEPAKTFSMPVAQVPVERPMQMSRQTIYEEPARFAETTVPHTPSTLTYIEDTEPLLPPLDGRIRPNADFVAVPLRRVAEPVAVEEEEAFEEQPRIVVHEHKTRGKFSFGRMQTLAVVAVVVLALVALGSTLLATSIKVTDGGTASVGFTIK